MKTVKIISLPGSITDKSIIGKHGIVVSENNPELELPIDVNIDGDIFHFSNNNILPVWE